MEDDSRTAKSFKSPRSEKQSIRQLFGGAGLCVYKAWLVYVFTRPS